MDGIDIALISSDGEFNVQAHGASGTNYTEAFRESLKQGLKDALTIKTRNERPQTLSSLERDLTILHAQAVHVFLRDHELEPKNIDVIGFHGQTVLHRPGEALTVQIGDGTLLAEMTGIPVVYDMRANDMLHGGQGAPLIPVYHQALAKTVEFADGAKPDLPVVFVNIGGISNLTFVSENGNIAAFDSGPGNALIDQWIEMYQMGSFDVGGAIALNGKVNETIAARYMDSDFFTNSDRRSLDRGDFLPLEAGALSLEDGARTLSYVSAASIIKSAEHLPESPKHYIVSGGGRKNAAIMAELQILAQARGAKVSDADLLGIDGDAMEAEAWAYLAIRSLKNLPLTFPATTGCEAPVSGGILVLPEKNRQIGYD